MSSKIEPISEDLKTLVRAVVMSGPSGKVQIGKFSSDFKKLVHMPFPFKMCGFQSTFEALKYMSDTVTLVPSKGAEGNYLVDAVITPDLNLPSWMTRRAMKTNITNKGRRNRHAFKAESLSNVSNSSNSNARKGTVFITNCPDNYTKTNIADLFQDYKFHDIREYRKGRPCFFIDMDNTDELDRAVKEMNHKVQSGRQLVVSIALSSQKNKNNTEILNSSVLDPKPTKGPPPLEKNVPIRPPGGMSQRPVENSDARATQSNFQHQNHQKGREQSHTNLQNKTDNFTFKSSDFCSQEDEPDDETLQNSDSDRASGYSVAFNRLIEVCIANFPHNYTKKELKDLVVDFQPMKIVMGNNKPLPPPDNITFAYVYFLDEENARDCIEVLDTFLLEDNILFVFNDDNEDDDLDHGSHTDEFSYHVSELASKLNLRSQGSNKDPDDEAEPLNLHPSGRHECHDDDFEVRKDNAKLAAKLYPHESYGSIQKRHLVSKMYPEKDRHYDHFRESQFPEEHQHGRNWHENWYHYENQQAHVGKPRRNDDNDTVISKTYSSGRAQRYGHDSHFSSQESCRGKFESNRDEYQFNYRGHPKNNPGRSDRRNIQSQRKFNGNNYDDQYISGENSQPQAGHGGHVYNKRYNSQNYLPGNSGCNEKYVQYGNKTASSVNPHGNTRYNNGVYPNNGGYRGAGSRNLHFHGGNRR